MTTIAYKDGIIAYDSRMVIGDTIVDDDYNKCHTRKGVKIFISGSPASIENVWSNYDSASYTTKAKESEMWGLAYDEGVLYYVTGEDNHYSKQALDLAKPFATGSGWNHAITAMDMGASAKKAVKMAAKRDTHTGGRIRTFKIDHQ